MKEPGDYTIAAIERGEAIPKLAFRAAELRGDLAPHLFMEHQAYASCNCGMEIIFEEKDARTRIQIGDVVMTSRWKTVEDSTEASTG